MKITRVFTKEGKHPFDTVTWVRRDAIVRDVNGNILFEAKNIEVPSTWSAVAYTNLANKYFRKTGVPLREEDAEYLDLPEGTWAENGVGYIAKETGERVTGSEMSLKQVAYRLAAAWTLWGVKCGHFGPNSEDARIFQDEIMYMLIHQIAAPNSPQWFNTGLFDVYGIKGRDAGQWCMSMPAGRLTDEMPGIVKCKDSLARPQSLACFILSVADDLVGEDGIFSLWQREACIFKFGSGSGVNMSSLRSRGEPLSGGGTSSGLMSWLNIGDRAAGAIKSGGTTRRAALMRVVDIDHPDILDFINWKASEELKVKMLVQGAGTLEGKDAEYAESVGIDNLDYDWLGEAYTTVSGQNSNNSVRIPSEFFNALDRSDKWYLRPRTSIDDPDTYTGIDAQVLWDAIGQAAWRCADPGVQFDTIINDWHMAPSMGRIRASNPCSEFHMVDNTGCNLASLNLMKFYDGEQFDFNKFEKAVRLWTIVLDITVTMSSYPSKDVAINTAMLRNLGLGYANMGALLMAMGMPYDSDVGRAAAAVITAYMHGVALRTSSEMANELGCFPAYKDNEDAVRRVVHNHHTAVKKFINPAAEVTYTDLTVGPHGVRFEYLRDTPVEAGFKAVETLWDEVRAGVDTHGLRNAQVTLIAPTGTIGLVMDCMTTGIEPDYALVKVKTTADGGTTRIAGSLTIGLYSAGYDDEDIIEVNRYVFGNGVLPTKVYDKLYEYLPLEKLQTIERGIVSLTDIHSLITVEDLGRDLVSSLGYDYDYFVSGASDVSFTQQLLQDLDLHKDHESIDAFMRYLDIYVLGHGTIDGCDTVKPEDRAIFACANEISPEGHIKMLGAVQPFLSGSASKTINCSEDTSPEDILKYYRLAHELGVKCLAVYRNNSKYSQPLTSKTDKSNSTAPAAPEQRREGSDTDSAPVQTRDKLPQTRPSITHKFNVGGHGGYITVGYYPDGKPGEIFITMSKEGSTIGGLMDIIATLFSLGLQYGIPTDAMLSKMLNQRFEPSGLTTNRDIPIASSIVDYVAQWFRYTHAHEEDITRGTVISAEPDAAPPPSNINKAGVHRECKYCGVLFCSASICEACPNCGGHSNCG